MTNFSANKSKDSPHGVGSSSQLFFPLQSSGFGTGFTFQELSHPLTLLLFSLIVWVPEELSEWLLLVQRNSPPCFWYAAFSFFKIRDKLWSCFFPTIVSVSAQSGWFEICCLQLNTGTQSWQSFLKPESPWSFWRDLFDFFFAFHSFTCLSVWKNEKNKSVL